MSGYIKASEGAVSQVSDEGKVEQEMKKTSILGVMLFAVFAFCAVSVSSALAVETAQWLVDGATLALTQEVNVDIKLTTEGVLLEDMNATLKPDVLCLVATGLGFVDANGEDEIVEGKCTSVESMTSGVTCATVEPVNLPWLTQLIQLTNGEFLDEIKSDGKGEPGWLAECTVAGIKVDDVCTSEGGKPTQENGTEEEVESIFLETVAPAEEAECTVGKNKTGLIAGHLLLDALSGNGLELLGLTVSLTPEVV